MRSPMALGHEPCYGLWRGFPAVRAVPGDPSTDDPRFGASSAAVVVPGTVSRFDAGDDPISPPREQSTRALDQIFRRMLPSRPGLRHGARTGAGGSPRRRVP